MSLEIDPQPSMTEPSPQHASAGNGSNFEAVGELQDQDRQRAEQRQVRRVSFAIPQPVRSPSSPPPNPEARPALKRKRTPVGEEAGDGSRTGSTDGGTSHAAKSAKPDGSRAAGNNGSRSRPHEILATQAEERRLIPELKNEPMVLPARLVFPIQVGSELFRLSGASISSDAPSYFSRYFESQLRAGIKQEDIRTLYIDRDPETFRDIALHLQGYHIEPRDGTHFVRLYADASFFSLPRLTEQLFKSTIFIRVGQEEFKIARDLFNGPGDTPNYFTLGFSVFFISPTNMFPGLENESLLRPPALLPPQVTDRSADVFRDLLHVLKGYSLHIRDEAHRAQLLRDARYFHLKGLEQKLIAHRIWHNQMRDRQEIAIRIDDIRPSGIGMHIVKQTPAVVPSSSKQEAPVQPPPLSLEAYVAYGRPYVDNAPYDLVLEIPEGLQLYCSIQMPENKLLLSTEIRKKMTLLCNLACNKIEKELNLKERPEIVFGNPKAVIERSAHVQLDGRTIDWRDVEEGPNDLSKLWIASLPEPPEDDEMEARSTERWLVRKSQWRLRVAFERDTRPTMKMEWEAVKIEAVSSEAAWNERRGWL